MKSIRRKMSLAIFGTSLTVLLVGGFGLYLSLRLALFSQFDASLETKADALVTASEVQDGEFEIDLDVQAFAGFGSTAPGDYFAIYSPDGSILQRSPSLGTADLPGVGNSSRSRQGFANLALPEGVEGRAYWTTFFPAEDTENRFENLRIVVASDLTRLNRTLGILATTIGAFGLTGLIATLILQRFVLEAGLKPLDRLSNDVAEIDIHRLGRRLTLRDLPSELHGVAGKLNLLLERLEASFARERRFTSHAGHELRTPLAELKSMTELGAAWPEEFTAEHIAQMLEAISELEELIEKLTLLSRIETGVSECLERVDLEAGLVTSLQRREKDIAERNLEIDVQVEPGDFHSDPVLWRSVTNNLIDNAIDYSPPGSRVKIRASPAGLAIENDAPQLEPGDTERLFERFWRKLDTNSGKKHSGLGLSIVRSSVEFLGGSCDASLENGRLRLEVNWASA